MKVNELTEDVLSKQIRVTKVAYSPTEAAGYCNDSEVLMGQVGVAVKLTGSMIGKELWVEWNGSEPGGLMLCGDDEIEVLP